MNWGVVGFVGLDYTEEKNLISTEDLPWAYPVQPITSAAMSGIGTTPLGPVEGTWVVGWFRDETNFNSRFTGTLSGIPQEAADSSTGFNDPSGKYPLEDRLKESDTNRLARGEESDTAIEQRKIH